MMIQDVDTSSAASRLVGADFNAPDLAQARDAIPSRGLRAAIGNDLIIDTIEEASALIRYSSSEDYREAIALPIRVQIPAAIKRNASANRTDAARRSAPEAAARDRESVSLRQAMRAVITTNRGRFGRNAPQLDPQNKLRVETREYAGRRFANPETTEQVEASINTDLDRERVALVELGATAGEPSRYAAIDTRRIGPGGEVIYSGTMNGKPIDLTRDDAGGLRQIGDKEAVVVSKTLYRDDRASGLGGRLPLEPIPNGG